MGGKGNGEANIKLHTNPPYTFLAPLNNLPDLKLYYKI